MLINLHFLTAAENETDIKNGKIGITFSSFGENDVFRFESVEGDASYTSDYFYSLGINYVYSLNKWLEAETDIEYSKHNIVIKPAFYPGRDNTSHKEDFSLINIPVTLRANFLKYFFVNGGLFFDVDASLNSPIDNQTGIGALFGLALKYDFKSGISAFVNPYTKVHSLIPFMPDNYQQRIWENGIRFGLTFDLGKLKLNKN